MAGIGFANEVRNLAERSAPAAKQVKALVATLATKVIAGTVLVKETGGALDCIANYATAITKSVSEMAEAARTDCCR